MKSLYLWVGAATLYGLLSQSVALPVYFPNLSVNKTTNQSTTFDQDGESEHAVDGIIEIETPDLVPEVFGYSCIATQIENSPWWMVDLGAIYPIEAAILTNKYECWEDMLTEAQLTVSYREDDPLSTQQVCYHNLTHVSKGRIEVRCNQWPYYFFGRYFFVSIPKDDWFLAFCELDVYPKIPHSLGEKGFMFDSQSATWNPSHWLAVERVHNYLYMNITLDSGSAQIVHVPPTEVYPDTPVRMGALDIDDTVLAPFSWSLTGEPVYKEGKVTNMRDRLTYQVQSTSGAVNYFNYRDLRNKEPCKLQTKCPPNSECTGMFMNEEFSTFDYMCKCREGYLSGDFLAAVNEFPDSCKGGANLAGRKPTSQSDTLDDAVSSRAVDGNIDSRFIDGKSCSSTTKHAYAWWRVDLEKLEYVAHVYIQFRYDCCESEATRFTIHVGSHLEDHFPVVGQEFKNHLCSNFTVTNISNGRGWNVNCGRTIAGRYVYIRLLENHRLTLCEVYVYSEDNDNIALAQSDYPIPVDGDLTTCHSVTSSFMIDLQYVRLVAVVHVLSASSVTDLTVTVGMDPLKGENCISSDGAVTANVLKEFVCNYPDRIKGRYVSLTITNAPESMNLCEVLVYAVYQYDLTSMRSATQSSYFIPEMRAEQAFDDDRGTCTASKKEADPWLKIDMGSNRNISEVVMYVNSTLPYSSEYEVFVDQHLCGVANIIGGELLTVICNPKALGKIVKIGRIGPDNMLVLCEVHVFAEVYVGIDDVCQSPYVCHSNYTCNSTGESYTCDCPHGYTADPVLSQKHNKQLRLDPVCIDVDECQFPDVCPNLICNNNIGSYRCECLPGFVRNISYSTDLEPVCEDVDECQLSADACRPELTCQNTIGSYRCKCQPGYYSNSSQDSVDPFCIIDEDECLSPDACRPGLVCNNTIGSYICQCSLGYTQDPSSNNTLEPICLDIDECQLSVDACRSDLNCKNTNGSYRCECPVGFTGDPDHPSDRDPVCIDVDECVNSVESLGCSPHSDCINFVGSYFCGCKEGYLGDGRTCHVAAAAFEMVCRDRGGVVQSCDESGTFRCKCAWGYVYDSQTNTCQPAG